MNCIFDVELIRAFNKMFGLTNQIIFPSLKLLTINKYNLYISDMMPYINLFIVRNEKKNYTMHKRRKLKMRYLYDMTRTLNICK